MNLIDVGGGDSARRPLEVDVSQPTSESKRSFPIFSGPGNDDHVETSTQLGYRFDPVPRVALDLVRTGRILATDIEVLAVLLRFRPRGIHSAWCTKATVAEALGCSTRTVQRALYRLTQAYLIAQEAVGPRDPLDAKNRTGWRIVFRWLIPPEDDLQSAPLRPGQGVSRGDIRVSPPQVFGCPGETSVSPPPETFMSPKYQDGIKQDGKPPSAASLDAAAEISPQKEQDSSSRLDAACEAMHACFGSREAMRVRIQAEQIARQISGRWDLFELAILDFANCKSCARIDNPIGAAITVAREFERSGAPETLQAARASIVADIRSQATQKTWGPLLAKIQVVTATEFRDFMVRQGIGLKLTDARRINLVWAAQPTERLTVGNIAEIPPAIITRLRELRDDLVALLDAAAPSNSPPASSPTTIARVPKNRTAKPGQPAYPGPHVALEPGPFAIGEAEARDFFDQLWAAFANASLCIGWWMDRNQYDLRAWQAALAKLLERGTQIRTVGYLAQAASDWKPPRREPGPPPPPVRPPMTAEEYEAAKRRHENWAQQARAKWAASRARHKPLPLPVPTTPEQGYEQFLSMLNGPKEPRGLHAPGSFGGSLSTLRG